MIIKIDRRRCSGHAVCGLLEPELFTIDDEGYSTADGTIVPPAARDRALRGVNACPERAIRLEDEAGQTIDG